MRWLTLLLVGMALAACTTNSIGLDLAPGWSAHSMIVWRHLHPESIVTTASQRYLYITCNTSANPETPSLYLYNLKS